MRHASTDLVDDAHPIVTYQMVELDEELGDLVAEYRLYSGTSGVGMNFGVYVDFEDDDEDLRAATVDALMQERLNVDNLVESILLFQRKFNEAVNVALNHLNS